MQFHTVTSVRRWSFIFLLTYIHGQYREGMVNTLEHEMDSCGGRCVIVFGENELKNIFLTQTSIPSKVCVCLCVLIACSTTITLCYFPVQALTLKDNSKYGTFINDAQLATGTVQTLNSGDRLTFGVYQSKFK